MAVPVIIGGRDRDNDSACLHLGPDDTLRVSSSQKRINATWASNKSYDLRVPVALINLIRLAGQVTPSTT